MKHIKLMVSEVFKEKFNDHSYVLGVNVVDPWSVWIAPHGSARMWSEDQLENVTITV